MTPDVPFENHWKKATQHTRRISGDRNGKILGSSAGISGGNSKDNREGTIIESGKIRLIKVAKLKSLSLAGLPGFARDHCSIMMSISAFYF